jgi:transposase
MARPSKYSPEVRERFVRLVQDHTADHGSQWAAIAASAPKAGCTTETLRRWVRQAERDAGQRAGLTTDERAELKQLQREVVELKRANEILKKASVNSTVRRNTIHETRRDHAACASGTNVMESKGRAMAAMAGGGIAERNRTSA